MPYIIAGIIGFLWYINSGEPEPSQINSYTPSHYNSYSNDSYGDSEYYSDYTSEPENPYDEGGGHYAGYSWAEENDVDSCDGNSDSFIEGCEEYVSQRDSYDEYEEYNDEEEERW